MLLPYAPSLSMTSPALTLWSMTDGGRQVIKVP
jgi:hypothetical protein